jgi:hypothetical protein
MRCASPSPRASPETRIAPATDVVGISSARFPVRACVALLAAFLAAGGLAATPPAREPDHRALRQEAISALILHATPDTLATAAALSYKLPTSPTALELSVSAAEAAPQDAAIAWLHLRLCVEAPLCDFRDAATVLRWVDADNGASWLPILDTAVKDHDVTEIDRLIEEMSLAPHFDLYWNRLVVRITDTLKQQHATLPKGFAGSDAERFDLVSGIVSELVPGFSLLLDACRSSPPGSERRDRCLKLSLIMQKSDTVAAQIAGFGVERRLVNPDSKEARALVERRRLLEWRVATAAQFDAPVLPWLMNARAHARLVKMHSLPREEDVCIAILKEHKIGTEPAETHR